jgi:hypothetical protein
MQGEKTIFPRMFLSSEAATLIRSFNCDAVYSQPVRIAQPAPLSSSWWADWSGDEEEDRCWRWGRWGREREGGPPAVLIEMW